MPIDDEIVRYLAQHPGAQDTLEGIAQWWVLEQRIEATMAEVKVAVDTLLAANLVIAHPGVDGRIYYRANPAEKLRH